MAKMPPMSLELLPYRCDPREGAPVYTINPMHRQCRRVGGANQPVMLKVRACSHVGRPVCPGCDWCCKLPDSVAPGELVWITTAGVENPDPRTMRAARMAW